jgi:hypothetical protein
VDILFCSRGRGRGHATRDLAIVDELRSLKPGIRIAFASYSDGASMLQSAGEIVYDLGLPERNLFPETVLRSYRVIQLTRPRLVVAQEELAALTAAAVAGTKAVFTTHWFPGSNHELTQALAHAHRVIFMEESGIFKEPMEVQGRVVYVGPVLRRFKTELLGGLLRDDKLSLTSTDTLITVLPGSPLESREPILDLVVSAFRGLALKPKRLIWLAGNDYAHIRSRLRDVEDTYVLESLDNLDQIILASSVILTKGTYNTSREVMALGKASISLSHRYNWVDDIFARRWPNNRALFAAKTNGWHLTKLLEEMIERSGCFSPHWDLLLSTGARKVAVELVKELENADYNDPSSVDALDFGTT